jgi:hypothetical protein
MSLMATARGRSRKRIVKAATVTAGLASRLRLSRTAERVDRRQAASYRPDPVQA